MCLIIHLYNLQNTEYLGMQVIILGDSYKKNIGIATGSPSRLLQYYLDKLGVDYRVIDPYSCSELINFNGPKLFFVATPHDDFKKLSMPQGSQIIDPWGNSTTSQYGVMEKFLGRNTIWQGQDLQIDKVLEKIELGSM